ncbi:RDD family protein [Roseivirga sp. BDSF3-8]|uniref:RDD family protein n=1 Tax=Roseivirga sp. BDSF3-8 TaxID=3241598 RepID=UPI003531E6D4
MTTQSVNPTIYAQVGPSLLGGYSARLAATLIDVAIALMLSVIPLLGVAYFLLRDALPFFDGQSVGKYVMNIRVIEESTRGSVKGNYKASILRNVPLIIPIFQFLDAFLVFSSNRKRLGDNWGGTVVIKA